MPTHDEMRSMWEDQPTPVAATADVPTNIFDPAPAIRPTKGLPPSFQPVEIPGLTEMGGSYSQNTANEVPELRRELDAFESRLSQDYLRLEKAFHDKASQRTLEGIATAALAHNVTAAAKSAERGRGNGKVWAGTIGGMVVGLLIGAAATKEFYTDKIEELLGAGVTCEVADNTGNIPFTPAPSPTASSIPTSPNMVTSGNNAFLPSGNAEQQNGQATGALVPSGEGVAIQINDNGEYNESDSVVFTWETLEVSDDHQQYKVKLLQNAASGFVPDAQLMDDFINGTYTPQEMGAFFVANGVIDPNIPRAYIQIIGFNDELLTEVILDAQAGAQS